MILQPIQISPTQYGNEDLNEQLSFYVEDTQDGCYRDVISTLHRAGWKRMNVLMTERNKNQFKYRTKLPLFIWTIQEKDVPFRELEQGHITNHFEGITNLTTKMGFCNLLRDDCWLGIDRNEISPRCYNLGDSIHRLEFVEDFKLSAAISILRIVFCRLTSLPSSMLLPEFNHAINLSLRATSAHLRGMNGDHSFATQASKDKFGLEEAEWEVIFQSSRQLIEKLSSDFEAESTHFEKFLTRDSSSLEYRMFFVLSALSQCMHQFALYGVRNIWIVKAPQACRGLGMRILDSIEDILECERGMSCRTAQKYIENPLLINFQTVPSQAVRRMKFDLRIWVLVTSFSPLRAFIYSHVYGRRCISEFTLQRRNLSDFYIHLTNYSIQKKAFSSNVTNNNNNSSNNNNNGSSLNAENAASGSPRAAVLKLRGNKENKTRNSKSSAPGSTGVTSAQEITEEDLLITHEQVVTLVNNYQQSTTCPNAWSANIWPEIKRKILMALELSKQTVSQRAQSFELLGFDVLLDNCLQPWILEVNMSPAMAHRSDRQSAEIEHMVRGLLDLTVPNTTPLNMSSVENFAYSVGESFSHRNELGHWESLIAEQADAVSNEPSITQETKNRRRSGGVKERLYEDIEWSFEVCDDPIAAFEGEYSPLHSRNKSTSRTKKPERGWGDEYFCDDEANSKVDILVVDRIDTDIGVVNLGDDDEIGEIELMGRAGNDYMRVFDASDANLNNTFKNHNDDFDTAVDDDNGDDADGADDKEIEYTDYIPPQFRGQNQSNNNAFRLRPSSSHAHRSTTSTRQRPHSSNGLGRATRRPLSSGANGSRPKSRGSMRSTGISSATTAGGGGGEGKLRWQREFIVIGKTISIESIMFIDKSCKALESTLLLQRWARRYLERLHLFKAKQQRSALKIQQRFRLFSSKSKLFHLRRRKASTIIQCAVRCWLARRIVQKIIQNNAALLIQSIIRRFLCQKLRVWLSRCQLVWRIVKWSRRQLQRKRINAASVIGRAAKKRLKWIFKCMRKIQHLVIKFYRMRNKLARLIQRIFKKFVKRRHRQRRIIFILIKLNFRRRNRAVRCIQRNFRRYFIRQQLQRIWQQQRLKALATEAMEYFDLKQLRRTQQFVLECSNNNSNSNNSSNSSSSNVNHQESQSELREANCLPLKVITELKSDFDSQMRNLISSLSPPKSKSNNNNNNNKWAFSNREVRGIDDFISKYDSNNNYSKQSSLSLNNRNNSEERNNRSRADLLPRLRLQEINNSLKETTTTTTTSKNVNYLTDGNHSDRLVEKLSARDRPLSSSRSTKSAAAGAAAGGGGGGAGGGAAAANISMKSNKVNNNPSDNIKANSTKQVEKVIEQSQADIPRLKSTTTTTKMSKTEASTLTNLPPQPPPSQHRQLVQPSAGQPSFGREFFKRMTPPPLVPQATNQSNNEVKTAKKSSKSKKKTQSLAHSRVEHVRRPSSAAAAAAAAAARAGAGAGPGPGPGAGPGPGGGSSKVLSYQQRIKTCVTSKYNQNEEVNDEEHQQEQHQGVEYDGEYEEEQVEFEEEEEESDLIYEAYKRNFAKPKSTKKKAKSAREVGLPSYDNFILGLMNKL